jgi:hypothetical protein
MPHVTTRPKLEKSPNQNSPTTILFVDQRETLEFPQNISLYLATLFSVEIRAYPFSEPFPQNPKTQKGSNSHSMTLISAHSHRP